MYDKQSFEFDLELLLDNFQLELIDLDFLSDSAKHILKNKLLNLYDKYTKHEDDHIADHLIDHFGG